MYLLSKVSAKHARTNELKDSIMGFATSCVVRTPDQLIAVPPNPNSHVDSTTTLCVAIPHVSVTIQVLVQHVNMKKSLDSILLNVKMLCKKFL